MRARAYTFKLYLQLDIVYFPAFCMTGSLIRQYIGNTNVIFIFFESMEPFDASLMHELGKMTQSIFIIQPYPNFKYRYFPSLFHYFLFYFYFF